MSDQPKSSFRAVLKEITQPFIDLVHAPRALWGINLSYILEGMVYFGMLGYLAIHFSDYIFQSVDHADEWSHNMVMVLTAGITIAMFFLGAVADKKGVRFALIAAFCFMVAGRALMSGAPTVMGLEPVRPGVVAGDVVSLHVTEIAKRDGHKSITEATVIENNPGAVDVEDEVVVDLAAGVGVTPDRSLQSKVVSLSRAKLIGGESPEWTVEYGDRPVTATLLLHTSEQLGLRPGSVISLRRAYVFGREKKPDDQEKGEDGTTEDADDAEPATATATAPPLPDTQPADVDAEGDGGAQAYEYVIRSHWLDDVVAVDTFPSDLAIGEGVAPNKALKDWPVQLSAAKVVAGEGRTWTISYGSTPVTAQMTFDSRHAPPLCVGAQIALHRAMVDEQLDAEGKSVYVVETDWPADVATVGYGACEDAESRQALTQKKLVRDLARGDGVALDESLRDATVQLSRVEIVKGDGRHWAIRYGAAPVTAQLRFEAGETPLLGAGALVALARAKVVEDPAAAGSFYLAAEWPEDIAAVTTYPCASSPYPDIETAREQVLTSDSRWQPQALEGAAADAPTVSLAELREMDDGPVNVIVRDAEVTYVRNGGYLLGEQQAGSAISAIVSPFWSPLHIVTLVGMILVVIGYGMYQPAAYAGVRQFTTPKTAAMGFAMLYALMNLGGWLPTFAFLARDEDFLGLGITGTFWIYTGFTVVALLATIVILSRKTVREATAAAKAETAAIKAAEGGDKTAEAGEAEEASASASSRSAAERRVQPHMWILWVGAMALFLFKSASPWYFTWHESWVRWALAGAIFILPGVVALWPSLRRWLANHPLEDGKFAFFIFALIPVQTLFTYNWLILPQYISRAFSGWMGEYFEIMANANPLLIFIAVPVITALTQQAKVYNMMIIGTLVMAAPAFILCAGPTWWALVAYLLIMTIGEAMWQPRFLQYAAEIAPPGRTGEYMGVAQLPWFLTKVLVPLLYSGRMMDRFCPAEGAKNTEMMWFIFGCIAIASPILLIVAKGWIGKDFKTKAE